MFHDLRLRSVWALFLAVGGMMFYSLSDAMKRGSVYSTSVFGLLFCISF